MIVHLVVLGLASAFSPLALAVVLVALGSQAPGRLLVAYLAGGVVVSIAIGIAVMGALQSLGLGHHRLVAHIGPRIDIAIGIAGIVIAGVLEYRRRAEHRRPPTEAEKSGAVARILARATPRAMFLLGLVMGFPGIYYLAALKEIDQGSAQWTARLALMTVVNVLAFVLIWIPLVAYLISPDRTRHIIGGVDGWLATHGKRIIIVVIAAAGIYELVRGIVGLS